MSETNGKTWRPVIVAAIAAAAIAGAAMWYSSRTPAEAEGTPRRLADLGPAELERLKKRRQEAYTLVYEGKLTEAMPELTKLTRSYPDDADSHMLLGRALLGLDRVDEALDEFTRVTVLDPARHEAHYNAGLLLLKQGDKQAALRHLMQAARLDETDPRYAMLLAQAEMDLDELDAAQVQLLRALRIDSNLPEAHARLADISARRGNLAVAIDQANKAIELVADKPDRKVKYVILKAKLLRRANKPEEALAVLLSVPPGQQQEEAMVEQIAASYLMVSEPRKAGAVWAERFAAEPTSARAAAEAGLCFHRAGEVDAARKYLGLAQRVDPAQPTVRSLEAVLTANGAGAEPR